MSMPLLHRESENEPAGADTPCRQQVPRAARVITILFMGKLISRHGESLCRVRNLSSEGLMIEVHAPLAMDDMVDIELKGGQSLCGRVRWVRELRMGIAFDQPQDVGSLLTRTALRFTEQGMVRRPRFVMDCPVELRCEGRRHAARLVNLSQSDARLEADFEPEQDQLLTLVIAGLPERRGSVRWTQEGALGLVFLEPLAFGELGAWLASSRAPRNS